MTQKHDDATQKFMEDVSPDKQPVDTYRSPVRQVVRSTIRGAQALQGPAPATSLGKVILRTGIGALARSAMNEKQAAEVPPPIHILDVYEKLNNKYDKSWWDWEPETVERTLFYDFGIDWSEDGVNIIGALQTILSTNFAHESWHVFEKVGHALNTNHVDFTVVQPLDLDEVALAIALIGKIRPQTEYEGEVCSYMAAVARNNGIVYLPTTWFPACAQERLDDLNNDLELKGRVQSLWESGTKTHEDPMIENQLGALREIEEYLEPHLRGAE